MQTDLFGDEPKVKAKKRIGYIDADIVAYKACCAGNKSIIFGSGEDEDYIEINDFKMVQEIFDDTVERITNTHKIDESYLCFSHNTNYRKCIIPYYKSNRTQEKPIHLKRIINYAKEKYNCIEHAGLEGDDVCGIYCTAKPKAGESRIGISIDKDFKTLPIIFIDLSNGESKISWLDSFRNLCIQILTGDAVDGYKGLKNVGKVKAGKIVDDIIVGQLKHTVGSKSFVAGSIMYLKAEFKKVMVKCEEISMGDGYLYDEAIDECEKYFWQQVQCAYILRDGDYDVENKKVRLITHNNFCEMLKDKNL